MKHKMITIFLMLACFVSGCAAASSSEYARADYYGYPDDSSSDYSDYPDDSYDSYDSDDPNEAAYSQNELDEEIDSYIEKNESEIVQDYLYEQYGSQGEFDVTKTDVYQQGYSEGYSDGYDDALYDYGIEP